MFWWPVLAGVIGFAIVYFPKGVMPPISYLEYVSLAALAGIDSLIGGLRAAGEGKFRGNIFVSGFFFNTVVAALLALLGERLGQPLNLAAVVALGGRIFVNLSIIRRHFMDAHEPLHPAEPSAAIGAQVGPLATLEAEGP